jgi:hypothetical protein
VHDPCPKCGDPKPVSEFLVKRSIYYAALLIIISVIIIFIALVIILNTLHLDGVSTQRFITVIESKDWTKIITDSWLSILGPTAVWLIACFWLGTKIRSERNRLAFSKEQQRWDEFCRMTGHRPE